MTRTSRSSSNSIVRGEHRIRLRIEVLVDRGRQPLRSLLVCRERAVPSVFDELPFLLLGDLQVGRAQALSVPTAGDREVRPVLTTAFPKAHLSPSLSIAIARSTRVDPWSTADV